MSEIFETLFSQLLSKRAALARCKGVEGGECGDQPAIWQIVIDHDFLPCTVIFIESVSNDP